MSIPFGQKPNYINVPMYRKGIEQRLANGEKVYDVVCVDNDNTNRHIEFQIISRKRPEKLKESVERLKQQVFYNKYLYTPEGMTHVMDEIKDIDEINTSILFVCQ